MVNPWLAQVGRSLGYTLHSSIWLFAGQHNMRNSGCPQEIDVVEQYLTDPNSNVSKAAANLHPFTGCNPAHAEGCKHAEGGGKCQHKPYKRPLDATAIGEWTSHWTTIIVDWTEAWIGMRVNGVPYAAFTSSNATSAFTDELFLALTSCVMKRVPPTAEDALPLTYEIDHVKVYRWKSNDGFGL